jgi:hypothetical protein
MNMSLMSMIKGYHSVVTAEGLGSSEVINRRYENFSHSFKYYSQRERIVGMSYNRTLFVQAFDNDGSVDEGYIRDHFKIARPYLFSDALYFLCYEEKSAKDELIEAVNVEMDINSFLKDENEEEENTSFSLSERVAPKPPKGSSFSVYKDLKKMDNIVKKNKFSRNNLSISTHPTRYDGHTVKLEAMTQPANVTHFHISEKYVESLVNKTQVSEKKQATKVGIKVMDVFLFLDEIDQDLRGDVTLSEDQRKVFMYYLMKHHGLFNRIFSAMENSAVISILVLLIFWFAIPQMVSDLAGAFVDDVSVIVEVGFAILTFMVIFIVVIFVYSNVFIIVLCLKSVKIEDIKKSLK